MFMGEYACLTNTAAAGHSVNKMHPHPSITLTDGQTGSSNGNISSPLMVDKNMLAGHTIWINEHMAVGHAMYDIFMMQLFAVQRVDRIILQRAACLNRNQCVGVGTWDGWYEGYYSAILEAFAFGSQDVAAHDIPPIYVRWIWQEKRVSALLLRHGDRVDVPRDFVQPTIALAPSMCFERVYIRRCPMCFRKSLTPSTVQRFKAAAYAIANRKLGFSASSPSYLHEYFSTQSPIFVTFSYRGVDASRHIKNPELMTQLLQQHLPQSEFRVKAFQSSNTSVRYYEQVALVAGSHIVISEHGAFQSNMIYMRNSSLYIELRGNYGNGHEYENFEALAAMFGLLYSKVMTNGLTFHGQDDFNISTAECLQVIDIVKEYSKQRPYLQNIRGI